MESDLELENEEVLEEAVGQTVEQKEETNTDFFHEAESAVMDIITKNIFDGDLKLALQTAISEHFMGLEKPPAYKSDPLRIPDLNQKIWDTYRNYEDYIYQNKIQNASTAESGKILREHVVPKITELLSRMDMAIRSRR